MSVWLVFFLFVLVILWFLSVETRFQAIESEKSVEEKINKLDSQLWEKILRNHSDFCQLNEEVVLLKNYLGIQIKDGKHIIEDDE